MAGVPLGPLLWLLPLYDGRDAIAPVPDQFHRDLLKMIAMLFAPMLAGAIVIPLLMILFSLMGYKY
jgi:hypothetical protein